MLLMWGCCRAERFWAFRSGCKLSSLFESAVPQRELDRIFTNVQNSKSASLQHRLANFGFERTLEIMMLVWLWLEVLPCGRAAPIMRMRCTNEENFQTPASAHFSASCNCAYSKKHP